MWYNSNWFSAIIGAIVSVLTTGVTMIITSKNKCREDKKNLIYILSQLNPILFKNIFSAHIDEKYIDFIELRKEIEKKNFIYFSLPKDARELFFKLYKLFHGDPQSFQDNKNEILNILKKMYNVFSGYGEDIFNG